MKKYSRKINIRVKVIFILLLIIAMLFVGINIFNTATNSSKIVNSINEENIINEKYITEDVYISENNYEEEMKKIVEPYINSKLESGYIDGDEGVKLYYEKYKVEDPKGNIVLCHGYTESLEKYHEMIYYFIKNGYNVFGVEHRGHGRSGTLGIADKTQIDVGSFNQYVTDFKVFMDEIVMPNKNDNKVLLFAHSMGGAIGAKFLEDYPDYFNGAILNSPMLEVNTGDIPEFLANIIVSFEVGIGNGGKYVLGKGPYTPDYDINKIGTSSINRFKYGNEIVVNNEEFQRGEASYNWTNEAFKVTKEIVNEKNALKVEIPVLLFQAGQDTYVKPDGQNKFAKGAKNCKIKKIENSRHEIYRERDEIQKPYLNQVLDFYNQI